MYSDRRGTDKTTPDETFQTKDPLTKRPGQKRGHPFMTSTRRGRGVRLGWTHVDGGGGPAPCGRPHRKLKLESTDVILPSSHAKKLASFLSEFRFWTEKSGNFSAI